MHSPIFLADNVSPDAHGKHNFEGTNLSDTIFIEPPYDLCQYVVVSFPHPPTTLSFQLTLFDASAAVLFQTPRTVGSVPPPTDLYMPLLAPVRLRLEQEGSMRFEVETNFGTVARTWQIKVGKAPVGWSGFRSQHILDATTAGASQLPIQVLGAANRTLDIADQYLDRRSALRLLKAAGVPSKVKVRLLVSQEKGQTYRQHFREIRRSYPAFEVRAGRRIHDRIVIANSSEVHVFGGSLKDLNNGRVTFAVRVTDQAMWKGIIDIFESEWAAATPV